MLLNILPSPVAFQIALISASVSTRSRDGDTFAVSSSHGDRVR